MTTKEDYAVSAVKNMRTLSLGYLNLKTSSGGKVSLSSCSTTGVTVNHMNELILGKQLADHLTFLPLCQTYEMPVGLFHAQLVTVKKSGMK